MFESLQDRSVQKYLALVVLLIVAYYLIAANKKENFNSEESPTIVPLEVRQSEQEIPIGSPYVNNDVRSRMSGSGFIPQKDVIPAWGMNVDTNKYGIVDGLDDGEGGSLGLNYNLCSKSCCSEQWPTPFKLPYDKFICGNKDKFMPSPYMCNNAWQDSGCVCLTKKQSNFLTERGTNA